MEAAVLNPPIMTDVNCNGSAMNAELEVKKLQELVRKLERQNEQLRTRANAVNGCASPHLLPPGPVCLLASSIGAVSCCVPSPAPTLSCQTELGQYFPSEEPFPYFQPHSAADAADEDETSSISSEPTVLDEVEILDLDTIFPGNEESDETWLYFTPRSHVWPGGGLTPLQWCRHVLDLQHPEVDTARHTLCQRLDSVNRWRGVFPSPSSPAFPHGRIVGVSPLCTSSPSSKSCAPIPSTASCERPASSISLSPHSSLFPTLTPNGKDRSLLAERTPTFLYHPASRSRSLRRAPFSPQSSLDSELSGSGLDDDSITLGYKLQDLTDVQVMARLQEESLRQDYATTTTSSLTHNRRSASFSFQFGQRGESHLDEEEEDDDEDYGQLPPPQPRLTRAGPLQRGLPHSHTFTSIRDWRRSTSTPSTPQYPSTSPFQPQSNPTTPGYSTEQPSLKTSSDKLRRSMPNLVRAPSMSCVPSPVNQTGSSPSIRNSQSFDSSSALARLQTSIPSPGQLQNRVQSVGNFSVSSRQPLKATAYVSPTVKGPSTMTTSTSLQSLSSSGIPQPSKAGSTQIPGRSGLPRPASFIATSSTPRSKLATPMRSLLTPPKSLATLSALRDGSWRDGCY